MSKSILELAKGHMIARHDGKHAAKRNHKRKDVGCVLCGRTMTVRDFENPPFYCYKCDQDIEGIHQ